MSVFNFDEVLFINFSFYFWASGAVPKKSFPNPKSVRIAPLFSSKSLEF